MLQLEANRVNRRVQALVDFLKYEAHHSPAARLEPSVAVNVICLLVRFTVDLNDRLRSTTCEIHDVRADGVLSPERELAFFAPTQTDPEQLSVLIMFPTEKPFHAVTVTEFAPGAKRGTPVQTASVNVPGAENRTYYWSTVNTRPDWYYKVAWTW